MGDLGEHWSLCQVWCAESPTPPSLCPQPSSGEGGAAICLCSVPTGVDLHENERGLAERACLGFLGHIPAAFPSKWAPGRRRSPCQSNSLLWNRETKSPLFYFGGVREGVGTPLIQPCSLLTCLSLSPPPGPRMSGAVARARVAKPKPENTRSRAGT